MSVSFLRTIALFSCFIYTHTATVPDTKCDGIHVRGLCHEKEVIRNNIDRPYQMSFHHKSEKLFFSYNYENDTSDLFKIAYIDIKNNEQHDVLGITNGFATAVDQSKDIVYLGGSEGIYKFHSKNKTAELFEAKGEDIWVLFFKDHLYYVDFPHQSVNKIVDRKSVEVPGFHNKKVLQFAIDGDKDYFYAGDKGLYRLKEEKDKTYDHQMLNNETIFRGFSVDHKGVAYFCGENGIYVIDKNTWKLNKIAHIKNTFGLTFDNDNNLIYSNPKEIVRLVPSSK